jgi:hypothetical protein
MALVVRALLACALTVNVLAQQPAAATLKGVVTDPLGAAMPGATVKATNVANLTPGYPLTLPVFLLLIAVLLVLLGGNNPRQALLGVGVVALGLPVYYLLFRRRSTATHSER